jgi:hypothetical protein
VYLQAELTEPPPVLGLDTLVDELTAATDDRFRRLGLAPWAVRVAEELVRVRSSLAAPPATARVAMSRLELAFTTARRHLAEEDGLDRGQPSALPGRE